MNYLLVFPLIRSPILILPYIAPLQGVQTIAHIGLRVSASSRAAASPISQYSLATSLLLSVSQDPPIALN